MWLPRRTDWRARKSAARMRLRSVLWDVPSRAVTWSVSRLNVTVYSQQWTVPCTWSTVCTRSLVSFSVSPVRSSLFTNRYFCFSRSKIRIYRNWQFLNKVFKRSLWTKLWNESLKRSPLNEAFKRRAFVKLTHNYTWHDDNLITLNFIDQSLNLSSDNCKKLEETFPSRDAATCEKECRKRAQVDRPE